MIAVIVANEPLHRGHMSAASGSHLVTSQHLTFSVDRGYPRWLHSWFNPVSRVDILGLADLPNHVAVGLDAMRQLGINLSAEQAECFSRGLTLPDLPDADLNGIASGKGDIPMAELLALKMEVSKKLALLRQNLDQARNQIQQRYPFLDLDDWYDWLPPAARWVGDQAAKYGRRVGYWRGDSTFIGPILSRTPGLRNNRTIRTHYGNLAYYHGMGDSGASAAVLQTNMVSAVRGLLEDFRKNGNCCRAYIELGMAVHMLTDSWTPGHVQRDASGSINLFQDYNRQSIHFHEYYDDLASHAPAAYDSAVNRSAWLIQMATGGGPLDVGVFFPLAPDARVGVVPGTEKATFWRTLFSGPSGGY